jgi:hypothetical protein
VGTDALAQPQYAELAEKPPDCLREAEGKLMAKHNKISGQFAARLIEMMESPAYRVLSLSAHRALSRIEIEWAHHGGQDNGQLPNYGVHRSAIGPALAELEALGFIVITERGKMARAADYRRPNKFLLTSRPAGKGIDPLHKWRRFKTPEEAEGVAEAARKFSGQQKKPPVRKTHWEPVRKTHHSGQIASAETVPLRMSETVPLSISRVGTPHLGEGNGPGPTRLTPVGLPLTPADALLLKFASGRSIGPKLVWRAPIVTELFGDEARTRRARVAPLECRQGRLSAPQPVTCTSSPSQPTRRRARPPRLSPTRTP